VESTQDQIVELVSSSAVLQALNRHSSHTKKSDPESKAAKSPMKSITKSPSKAPRDEVEGKGESKTRLVRRRHAIESSNDAGPSSPQRTARTKSPSPGKKRVSDTLASRSVFGEEEEDESMPPEDEEEPHHSSDSRLDPTNTPSRSRMSKPDPPPDDDEGMDEDKTPEPSPPPAPSQKTQQEKDEDEEEVLAKKREEMKRKMGAGGGGRLVRRRFG